MICNPTAASRDTPFRLGDVGVANVYFFKKDSAQSVKLKPFPTGDAEEQIDEAILCLQCRHRVSNEECCMEVNQRHQHTFTNPAQVRFTIGCFSDAPGCAGVGGFTSEFTWFTGYQWQIAVCGRCREHLGWKFRSVDHRFYGLILNRLIRSGAQ